MVFIEMEEKLLENPQPQSSFAIAYSSNAIALGVGDRGIVMKGMAPQ
jgi:hypothetical protein